jgi:hypothetical protein
MYKIVNYLLVVVLACSLCCTTKKRNSTENMKEQVFLHYLEETFNEKDISNEKMYVLIPCNGCKGCEQSVYSIFAQRLINNDDFTLIICNSTTKDYLSTKLTANNIIFDNSLRMADYDFGYGYPTCFVIKDNKIIDRYTLSPGAIQTRFYYNIR